MTIDMLISEVRKQGIPENWFSINGDLASDKLFLRNVHGRWEYFYFDERGNYNDIRWFEDEDSACKYLLEQLKWLFDHHKC